MTDLDHAIAGMCTGHGSCSFAFPKAFAIESTGLGTYPSRTMPRAYPAMMASAAKVDPMSRKGKNEDELAAALFGGLPIGKRIGRHCCTLATHGARAGHQSFCIAP